MKKKIVVQVRVNIGDYSSIEGAIEDVVHTLFQRDYDVDGAFIEIKSGIVTGWKETE